MTTATSRKTSFENQHLRSCDCFAIIPSSLNSTSLNSVVELYLNERRSNKYRELRNCHERIACLRCRQNRKCGNLTLLFCRRRHVIVPKFVPYVQHACILQFNQSNS